MINQKEFYQTKHYDDVVILDILSRYWTVVIVLKCQGMHLYYKKCNMTKWPHCTFCFRQYTMLPEIMTSSSSMKYWYFCQTKNYDGVMIILDILSKYAIIVIVLKCQSIHIILIVIWQTWPHCTFVSGNTQWCLC